MKIDSHQHFWHFNTSDYGWMDDKMNLIKKDFLPADLLLELQDNNFDASIAVQARQSLDETEWLLKLADKYDFIKGVVGWVDFLSPLLDIRLEEFGNHPKLVGLRHVIHDEIDDNFMLNERFIEGLQKLKDYNLTYDILIFEKHLSNTIEMVNKLPDQTFVLDHIGKPKIKEKSILDWEQGIIELAKNQKVYCKVSGMVTEHVWDQWNEEDFWPYLEIILREFGTERVMIGSDWPVCKLAGTYREVMNIVQNYISGLSEKEINNILGNNALKAYNIRK